MGILGMLGEVGVGRGVTHREIIPPMKSVGWLTGCPVLFVVLGAG